jgi:cellulose synthase/poly-beta-1,6-N-acetylglucosamine synthase-like glycosyltransferase
MMLIAGLYFSFAFILLIIYGAILRSSYKLYRDKLVVSNDAKFVDFREVSVVICVRNEGQNIRSCLDSIYRNMYPREKVQIIVVDDHSIDDTCRVIAGFPDVQYCLSPGHGKKQAQAHAVTLAQHDLVICTDGDTIVGPNWVINHVRHLSSKSFVTGLVKYEVQNDLIGAVQVFDNMATMCLTSFGIRTGRWHVANGANMSFHKSIYFDDVEFTEKAQQQVASGDDVFLIKKVVDGHGFESAIFMCEEGSEVRTAGESSWKMLWNQRKRWASKTMQVKDKQLIAFQGLVFILSASIVLGIFVGIGISTTIFVGGLALFLIKIIIDYFYLSGLQRLMNYENYFRKFWLSSFTFLLYTIAIGIYSLAPSRYQWKGRRLR